MSQSGNGAVSPAAVRSARGLELDGQGPGDLWALGQHRDKTLLGLDGEQGGAQLGRRTGGWPAIGRPTWSIRSRQGLGVQSW